MDAIEKARTNPNVEALYREVEGVLPIVFRQSLSNTTTWTVEVRSDAVDIVFGSARYPDAALAHELLHAKVQIAGYRRYLATIARPLLNNVVIALLGPLDNELQHFRMYPHFEEMGFRAEQFYHDGDKNTFESLRRIFERMKGNEAPEVFLTQFLSVLSPGGSISPQQRGQLKNRCQYKCGKRTWRMLIAIEEIMLEWSASDVMDAGDTIRNVLRVLDRYSDVWVGWDPHKFPSAGRFVDAPFSEEEAYSWHHPKGDGG
jgi:hypothetical protein